MVPIAPLAIAPWDRRAQPPHIDVVVLRTAVHQNGHRAPLFRLTCPLKRRRVVFGLRSSRRAVTLQPPRAHHVDSVKALKNEHPTIRLIGQRLRLIAQTSSRAAIAHLVDVAPADPVTLLIRQPPPMLEAQVAARDELDVRGLRHNDPVDRAQQRAVGLSHHHGPSGQGVGRELDVVRHNDHAPRSLNGQAARHGLEGGSRQLREPPISGERHVPRKPIEEDTHTRRLVHRRLGGGIARDAVLRSTSQAVELHVAATLAAVADCSEDRRTRVVEHTLLNALEGVVHERITPHQHVEALLQLLPLLHRAEDARGEVEHVDHKTHAHEVVDERSVIPGRHPRRAGHLDSISRAHGLRRTHPHHTVGAAEAQAIPRPGLATMPLVLARCVKTNARRSGDRGSNVPHAQDASDVPREAELIRGDVRRPNHAVEYHQPRDRD